MKRRHFFKILGSAIGISTIVITDISIKLSRKQHKVRYKPIKVSDIKNKFTFYDDFIITSSNNEIKVFSSKCTHLGCKINSFKNEEIICPCHGSSFNSNGKVIKGPASKDLIELDFEIINNELHITT